MNIANIGASGLAAYSLQMQAAALNIANMGTEGYVPATTKLETKSTGGVSATLFKAEDMGRLLEDNKPLAGARLEGDIVDLGRASIAYQANAALLRAEDRTVGSLIDQLA